MKKKKKPPAYKISQSELRKRLKNLKNCKEIQCTNGTFDYSPYMHGMANGLILALSIMEDEDPYFIGQFDYYISDTKHKNKKKKGKSHVRNKRSRRRK